MKAPTMQDINEDALSLRIEIDTKGERLIEEGFTQREVDHELKPLYDAVTRLHELATKGLES